MSVTAGMSVSSGSDVKSKILMKIVWAAESLCEI